MRRVLPTLPILPILVVLLAPGSGGCRKARPAASQTCPAPGVKPFGQPCAGPCDCASGLCWEFGDGEHACTQRCTDPSQCPSGSRGQKCTKQGICRI